MWQEHEDDNDVSGHPARARPHFIVAGSRGLAKDNLKHCLTEFEPDARVLGVADIPEAASVQSPAHLLLFDVNDMETVLPRDIHLVRERHTGIRIVAIGNKDPQFARLLMVSSVEGYVPRSTRLPDFYEALRTILDGGTFFPADCDQCPINDKTCRQILRADRKTVKENVNGALTKRQRDVLSLLGLGDSNKLIARKLGIAEKTAKIHVASICAVLGVDNRTRAAIVGLMMADAVTLSGSLLSNKVARHPGIRAGA